MSATIRGGFALRLGACLWWELFTNPRQMQNENWRTIGLMIVWLANPAMFVGWLTIRYRKHKSALAFSLIAVVLCNLTVCVWAEDVLEQPGYWLWTLSAGLLLVACLGALFPPLPSESFQD